MDHEKVICCSMCDWSQPAITDTIEGLAASSFALLIHLEDTHGLPTPEAVRLSRTWAFERIEGVERMGAGPE